MIQKVIEVLQLIALFIGAISSLLYLITDVKGDKNAE